MGGGTKLSPINLAINFSYSFCYVHVNTFCVYTYPSLDTFPQALSIYTYYIKLSPSLYKLGLTCVYYDLIPLFVTFPSWRRGANLYIICITCICTPIILCLLMQTGRGREVSRSISRQYRLDTVKQQAISELISEFESSLEL